MTIFFVVKVKMILIENIKNVLNSWFYEKIYLESNIITLTRLMIYIMVCKYWYSWFMSKFDSHHKNFEPFFYTSEVYKLRKRMRKLYIFFNVILFGVFGLYGCYALQHLLLKPKVE